MKVVVKPDFQLQTICSRESYTLPRERVIGLANNNLRTAKRIGKYM